VLKSPSSKVEISEYDSRGEVRRLSYFRPLVESTGGNPCPYQRIRSALLS
jgi:hypothetical protein